MRMWEVSGTQINKDANRPGAECNHALAVALATLSDALVIDQPHLESHEHRAHDRRMRSVTNPRGAELMVDDKIA